MTASVTTYGLDTARKRIRAMESTCRRGTAVVFYNLNTAVYARIRELGGEIRPFRAKALFIPLRPDVSSKDWKGLVYGEDFVLAKKVKHPATHVMKNTIRSELGSASSKTMKSVAAALRLAWDTARPVALVKRIGDEIAGQVRIAIKRRPNPRRKRGFKKSNQWELSVESRAE